MKHLISLNDLTKDEILNIITLAEKLKNDNEDRTIHHVLKGKTLGMIFSKSSTRTRVSFEVGMYQLGGSALFLSSNDIQLGRGESIYDTANVLSQYLDGIMIRTFKQSDVEDLAKYGSIPIVNGLTDLEHPCQILADLQTVFQKKGKLEGLKMAYIGDGNNIAHSLLQGCSKVGMDIAVAAPAGYTCDEEIIEQARDNAAKSGSNIIITDDPVEAISNADAVYTDTWVSMGQEEEKAARLKIFAPYQINKELWKHTNDDAIFLHCLPAYRGYEVTEDIIDGSMSAIFQEAGNRLHAQKAVMAMVMGNLV